MWYLSLYWYFLDKGFTFEPSVCNRCHDLLMSMNLSDIKSADYCYIISGISKNEAINSMQNADLTEKKVKNLLSCIKMGTEILTFGDIEIEKKIFYRYKSPVTLRDTDIEKVLVSNKISFGEKTTSTLLVICIMIIKLSYYI